MAASHASVELIVGIILKYVDPGKVDALVRELEGVRGNGSYRETIARIKFNIKKRKETKR